MTQDKYAGSLFGYSRRRVRKHAGNRDQYDAACGLQWPVLVYGRQSTLLRKEGHIGDDDPWLEEERGLEPEGRAASRVPQQGRSGQGFGDDHRGELVV